MDIFVIIGFSLWIIPIVLLTRNRKPAPVKQPGTTTVAIQPAKTVITIAEFKQQYPNFNFKKANYKKLAQ